MQIVPVRPSASVDKGARGGERRDDCAGRLADAFQLCRIRRGRDEIAQI